MKITFLLLPFLLSTSVHAMTCDLVFSHQKITNREELLNASKLSTKKPEYGPERVSEFQKYWSSRIMNIKTPEEAFRTLKQIVEGTSVLSNSKWLEVINEAGPQLLVKLETLDNLGVLDLAVVNDYITKQTNRMSEFTDATHIEALNKVFNDAQSTKSDYTYAHDAKFELSKVIESRKNAQYDFHREYTGAEAKEIYSALRIPEQQDAGGMKYKVLRSTDRGVVILMSVDPKNNRYFVEVNADTKSKSFSSQESEFYLLSPSRLVLDDNSLVAQSASANLLEANVLAHRDRGTRTDTDRRIFEVGDAKGNLVMKLVSEQRDINEGSSYSPDYTKKESSFAIIISKGKSSKDKKQRRTSEPVLVERMDPVSHIRAVRRGHWVNQFDAAGIFGKTLMMFDREFWEVVGGEPVLKAE